MDGISSDVSACVEGRVKKVNDQKAIPFASWKSRRVDAHRASKKAVGGFFHASPKKKRHVCAVFWCPVDTVCIPVSKNRKRKRWKKSACAKRARHPRTSSLRSESSLSLSRRFSASISCAASSAIANANASHYRATAPRASVSFPVVSCVPWMEGKWQTVSYRLGGTFSRSGARAGRRRVVSSGGDARAAMAGRRRRAPREPGAVEPGGRDPASRARARRRPSAFAAGSAKNDDADARERMTFEMRRGCRAYRRSRDRRARVHACAPFP